MIGSDVIRGYNDIFILYILLDGDNYGYEMSKRISELSGGVYTIKETTLYSTVNRLESNGFLDSYFSDSAQGRQRTYFRITRAGREYYKQKCTEWKETKFLINKFTDKF